MPGNGKPVTRQFVAEQQGQLAQVAALITELHAARVPLGDALRAGARRWALPQDGLDQAVSAGYAALAATAQPRTSSTWQPAPDPSRAQP